MSTMAQQEHVWKDTLVPKWIPMDTHTFRKADHKVLIRQVFQVLDGIHEFQKSNTFCDITINVEGKIFHAHKAVLAASSRYFQAMLTSEFQESITSEANISGKPEAFQMLLDFAYSGKLNLSMDSVIEVLEMAHYLQFDLVMRRCKSFLEDKLKSDQGLTVETALRILSKAEVYSMKILKIKCKTFLAINFTPSDTFLSLMTADLMKQILDMSELTNEKMVFDTTIAWLHHDWEGRKQYALALFKKIRLGTIPIGHLSMTVFKYPDLYAIPECKQLIDRVMELTDSRKPTDPPLFNVDPNLFATRSTVTRFLKIARHTYGGTTSYYNGKGKVWTKLSTFPQLPAKDCNDTLDACCNAGGNLFVSRGTEDLPRKLKHPQFLKLDVTNKKWIPLAPMKRRRQMHRLIYLNDKIYAIGGGGDNKCEVYDIKDESWQLLPAPPTDMFRTSCTTYEGRILVYGRTGVYISHLESPKSPGVSSSSDDSDDDNNRRGKQMHHLLMFDPALNSWTTMMSCSHLNYSQAMGLVVQDKKVYRIITGDCRCKKDACQWHEINIHEILVNFRAGSAFLGEKQESVFSTSGTFTICSKPYAKFQTEIYAVSNIPPPDVFSKDSKSMGLYTRMTFDKATFL